MLHDLAGEKNDPCTPLYEISFVLQQRRFYTYSAKYPLARTQRGMGLRRSIAPWLHTLFNNLKQYFIKSEILMDTTTELST